MMAKNRSSSFCSCATAKATFSLNGEEIQGDEPMRKVIQTEKAPKPVGPYSQAVKVDKFLFVSGQVAIDPKKGRIVENSIGEQPVRVMENIKAILHAAGYNLNDAVQSNAYL